MIFNKSVKCFYVKVHLYNHWAFDRAWKFSADTLAAATAPFLSQAPPKQVLCANALSDWAKLLPRMRDSGNSQDTGVDQGSENYDPWAQCGPQIIFVKNVILKPSHTHLCIIHGCFCTRIKLSSPDRDCMTHKA